MSERAAYSRVYWSIVDDPKFVTIYDSDAHLAAWLRLLLIADQAHPASAHLPSNVRRSSVKALAEAELVDLLPTGRYRIHGLDAERGRRKLAATRLRLGQDPDGDPPPPNRGPNGTQPGTRWVADGPGTPGRRRDEVETRRDEEDARATDADPEGDAITWLARHGCYLQPHSGYYRQVVLAVTQHGVKAYVGMLDRLASAGTKDGDVKGFVFGAKDALDARTRPDLKALDKEERTAEDAATWERRKASTKIRAHENGMHADPSPGCPRCESLVTA